MNKLNYMNIEFFCFAYVNEIRVNENIQVLTKKPVNLLLIYKI
jgi:hypothetical protein